MKTRILGVVTLKDDWAVQSFGFNKYLPLGKADIVIENLSKWGADEILVNCIDRSKNSEGPNINILKNIYKRKINTPIIYSGGIRNLNDAKKVINEGADRIAINYSAFSNDVDYFQNLSNFLGSQALILGCSFIKKKNNFLWYDYVNKKLKSISTIEDYFKKNIFSELLLIDSQNEGYNSFDYKVLENIDKKIPKILFGGINVSKIISKLKKFNIKSLGFGNRLNYKEIEIKNIKMKHKNYFRTND